MPRQAQTCCNTGERLTQPDLGKFLTWRSREAKMAKQGREEAMAAAREPFPDPGLEHGMSLEEEGDLLLCPPQCQLGHQSPCFKAVQSCLLAFWSLDQPASSSSQYLPRETMLLFKLVCPSLAELIFVPILSWSPLFFAFFSQPEPPPNN